MQTELRDAYPILDIQIIGINEVGHESANDLMMAERTTPWLQDVDADTNQVSDVWYDSWDVTYRDVIILDGQNEPVDVYNVTVHDLRDADDYAALKDKLIDAAMTEQKPWQNHNDRYDITNDGYVVPGDVLVMINEINANGPRELTPPTGTTVEAPFWDCSGDNFLSPLDVLQVINFIEGANGEGEASVESESALTVGIVDSPEADSLASAERAAIAAPIVDVTPETVDMRTPLAIVSPSTTSTDERVPLAESADDEFWADYLAGL